jgi:diaminohydroxyphosphoribosylaminopyrimidine deaminase/5-amino-6-(5-phosphoribosylamino)uracil reductase
MTAAGDHDRDLMRRAIELARRGPRGVNPQVGAVLVGADGRILAEGWHRGAGTPHAEVDALNHLADPGAAAGSTVVVTLEPCRHTGRTGPCTQALLDAGIARVVYGADDPTDDAGGGGAHLRQAGVEVTPGVLADEATDLISGWLTVQRLGRPHVTVKWAQSLDGRSAAADGTSRWITGETARADVHRRRAEADAVLAGTGTVLADDPALTARTPTGALADEQPLPVVMGLRAIPLDAAVRRHPRPPLFVDSHDPRRALEHVRALGVQTVFVEGGPTVASAFLREGLVDELLVYVAPMLLGGPRTAVTDLGIPSMTQAYRLSLIEVRPLGADLLVTARPEGRES